MKVPFLDLAWQHKQISEEVGRRFQAIFDKTAFVLGPDVEQFEKDFATYIGVKYAIGVANGTDALILSLRALELPAGSEAITIPTTFIATASAIRHAGLRPVFCDIDPDTRNFDFKKLEKAITPKTKVIVPVHLYGQPADMDKVQAFAKKHKLVIVEDACQAHGATFKGNRAGSFGALAAFSFYPGKNLGAYGDGGVVVTDDEALATKVKMLRNHGGIAKYEHKILGYNSRLDTLQAAVLDSKLPKLDGWNDLRIAVAERYRKALSKVKAIKVFPTLPNSKSVYHLYIIQLLSGDRQKFLDYLKEKEIGAGIHYPDALHLLPVFKDLGYKKGDFPVAEKYCQSIVSLPVFPGETAEQADYVAECVSNYFKS